MIDIGIFLSHNVTFTLFAVIGVGYIIGEVPIVGFRLGVAGVLFAGLIAGALDPTLKIPEIVSDVGLIVFVYTVGIQSGSAFFASLKKEGLKISALAIGAIGAGAVVAGLMGFLLHVAPSRTAGVFSGALTNTPALAAVRERLQDYGQHLNIAPQGMRTLLNDPVIGYSVSYPFGVVAVLLCLHVAKRRKGFAADDTDTKQSIETQDFLVVNAAVAGQNLGNLSDLHHLHAVITRISRGGTVEVPQTDFVLSMGDIVTATGSHEELEKARQLFGGISAVKLEYDRSKLDHRRFFVSKSELVGLDIGSLHLPERYMATATRIRRGDKEFVPDAEDRLEYGDSVRILAPRSQFSALSRLFGDSIKGTAEARFGWAALGMVIGVLVGMIPLPMLGGGTLRLGLAGGPLVIALIFGKYKRLGGVNWSMPLSANLTLRQIGVLLFMATIGTNAGAAFFGAAGIAALPLFFMGAAVTLSVTLITLIAGAKVLRMKFTYLIGVVSGMMHPAALVYAESISDSESVQIGYASVYPISMLAKIVIGQLLLVGGTLLP